MSVAEVYHAVGFGPFQWWMFAICGFGYMADAAEVGVISFLGHACSREWPATGQLAEERLVMVVFVGEFVGSFIWGPVADLFGRKKAFVCSNLIMVLFITLSACMPSFNSVVACQGMVGVGISGMVVPFDTLAESVEERHSTVLTFAISGFWVFGTVHSNALAAVVYPHTGENGWRWLLLFSIWPIIVACIGGFAMPESPVWLVEMGREEEAIKALQYAADMNGRDLGDVRLVVNEATECNVLEFCDEDLRLKTFLLVLVSVLGMVGYYGAALASPLLFRTKGGRIDHLEALFSSSGELVGWLAAAAFSHCFSPIRSLALCCFMATLGCCCIFDSLGPGWFQVGANELGLSAFVTRAAAMGISCAFYVVLPPAYPTHIRSTAHSILFGFGRIGGFLATSWPKGVNRRTMMTFYAAANLLNTLLTTVFALQITARPSARGRSHECMRCPCFDLYESQRGKRPCETINTQILTI